MIESGSSGARSEPGRTAIEGGLIVAFDGGQHRLIEDGTLVYGGDRIVHVGRRYAGPRATTIDARGKLVIPGQISAHAHVSAQEGGRLLIDGGRRDFFRTGFLNYVPTREDGPAFLRHADPRASLRFGLASLVRHGITTVVPFTPGGPDNGQALVEEATAFGLRLYVAPMVVSGRYHFDRAGRLARVLDERAGFHGLERAAEFIRAHHGAADGRIQGLVVLDEFYHATPALLRQAKAMAQVLGVGLTMHFAEQLVEFVETVRETQKTPVGLLEAEGILGSEVLLAHTVYVAGHRATAYPHRGDLEALAASQTTVVHSPLGLARRGVALESFQRYLEAGINVALGTDAYPLDMFGEMRTAALVTKLVEQNHEAGRAADLFAASNLGGARALGRTDLGRLAPGAKADIVLVDLENLAIGPVADPIRALVHLATPDMVETVICDGRVLLRERRLQMCDEAEVLGTARRSTQRVWAGYGDYHWEGKRLDQEFPPSIPPWQGD